MIKYKKNNSDSWFIDIDHIDSDQWVNEWPLNWPKSEQETAFNNDNKACLML